MRGSRKKTKVFKKCFSPKLNKEINKSPYKSNFDAQGSYTGVDPYDKYEKPVQDADDL